MTIADQLLSINASKQEIKAAIETKGVTVGTLPLADYAEKILEISGGGPAPTPWVRPADWLSMPTVTSTDQVVYMLMAVNNVAYNLVAFTATGSASGFNVDWGDGIVETAGNGTQINHNYDWNNVPAGTLTSKGYRQALITITPLGGGNLTAIDLSKRHTLRSNYQSTNSLDILISSPNLTSITIGSNVSSGAAAFHTQVERIRIPYTSATCTATYAFSACYSLRNIEVTSNLQFAQNAFEGCVSLEEVPALSFTGSGLLGTFSNCSSLKSIGTLTVNNGVSTVSCISMFSNCSSITSIPTITLTGSGKFSSLFAMFSNCRMLMDATIVGTWDLSAVSSTASMFSGCSGLETAPASLSLPASTSAASMFANCTALTVAPTLSLPVATTIASLFSGCTSLLVAPTITTSTLLITASSVFENCSAMTTSQLFTTTNVVTVASMFSACRSLTSIPAFNLAAVTAANGNVISPTTINGAFNLNSSAVLGLRAQHSYANSNLSATELDNIYTNLGTAFSGAIITVTGNPGVATDNPAIATAKGWTVTG